MFGQYFGSGYFGDGYFGPSSGVAAVAAVKTGTGGIDPGRRKTIFKPTGLVDRPRKEARKSVADRIEESRELHTEAQREARSEFVDEVEIPGLLPPISAMSIAQIDAEIGEWLRKDFGSKRQVEQDEALLILMAMLL